MLLHNRWLTVPIRATCLLFVVLTCWLSLGFAHDAVGATNPSVTIDLGQTGPKQTAVVFQILALLTVLSLAPAFQRRLAAIRASWLHRAGRCWPRGSPDAGERR